MNPVIRDRTSWFFRPAQKTLFYDAVFVALILFILSFIIRLLYYHSHLDLTTYESIVGVPFCDARHWNESAIFLAEGKGFSGLRPFYPIFLAISYTWFGPSFFLAKLLNIIVNSLTVSFIYLIARKVFNRWLSLAVAVIALFNIDYLTSNLTLMTEPLGLFLFVLYCYLMILGLDKKSPILLLFSGIVFSLCNLARAMTLVAFPGYLFVMFYVFKRQAISYKRSIFLISLFAFGVFATLAPWLLRQRSVYGVLSISPNSANLIYAATSPKYKEWNGGEVLEAAEKGLTTLKEQYDYFQREAFHNILRYPFFYFKNCIKSAYKFMACYRCHLSPIPRRVEFLLCLAGAVLLLFIVRNSAALILTNSAVFLVIGSAMIANAGTPLRLFTMVSWIFDFFYVLALSFFAYFAYSKIVLKRDELNLKMLAAGNGHTLGQGLHDIANLRPYLKFIGLLVVAFFIISSARIVYLNLYGCQAEEQVRPIDSREKMTILAEINKLRPGTFQSLEANPEDLFVNPVNELVNDPKDYKNNGKIVVNLNRIDKYLYFVPKDKKIHDWFRLFTHRNYDRSIFSMGNWGWVFYIFPGKIPDQFKEKYAVSVGKLSVDMNFIHEARRIVEVIAIIPYDGEIDYKKMIFASEKEHWKMLNHL
jgi:4-amino-4-deoxy-L-arabinose transferase-like glycosyltransferase